MQRVIVMGCSGSGKTTLARKLSTILNFPWTSMDKLFWKPGWVESSDEEFVPKVEAFCAQPRWIMDGTYSRTLPQRLPIADTVIWLDLPRRTCLWGVISRVLRGYGRVRADMPEGCPEQWDWVFLKWIWNYRRTHDHKHVAILSEWLGVELVRGGLAESGGAGADVSPRRVWWLTDRRQFRMVIKAAEGFAER